MSKKLQKKPVKKNDKEKRMKEIIKKQNEFIKKVSPFREEDIQRLKADLLNKNNAIEKLRSVLIALKKALWPVAYDSSYSSRNYSDEDVITEVSKIKSELQEKAALLEEIKSMNWYMVRLAMKDENLAKEVIEKAINRQHIY